MSRGKWKKKVWGIMFMIAALLLVSCGSNQDGSPPTDEEQTEETERDIADTGEEELKEEQPKDETDNRDTIGETDVAESETGTEELSTEGGEDLESVESELSDQDQIINVIRRYYEILTDADSRLICPDMSSVLDMNSIQCQNKVIAFQMRVDLTYTYLEEGVVSEDVVALWCQPVTFRIELISAEIHEESATATVMITHDEDDMSLMHESNYPHCATPMYVTTGENVFYLSKIDGTWKINGHDYENKFFYEMSKTELIEYEPIHCKDEN